MSQDQKLVEWFLGDEEAAKFMSGLFDISQSADDFADGEAGEDAAGLMASVLFGMVDGMALNPFFVANRERLAPMLIDALMAWKLSEELESGNLTEKAWAFCLRDSLERVLVGVALIKGGFVHALHVQREAFNYFRYVHADGHGFGAFVEEMEYNK